MNKKTITVGRLQIRMFDIKENYRNYDKEKIFTLCFSLIYAFIPIFIEAQAITTTNTNKEPNIAAKGAVLIEQESGRVLWERNSRIPLPMASTTKIMTCIIALENGNLEDIVTASKRAAAAPPVKLHLKPGEKQTLEDLLYALMLESSNDAAVAIAEHIGGTVENFCDMMTTKARTIGAEKSIFKTPNGLDLPGHSSSPYDLALITIYAYQNPKFIEIVGTPSRTIPSTKVVGSNVHSLHNKNRFLNSYPGANGVKTGFTCLAGHCFVGGAKRNDMQLFAVVLGSGWGQRGRSQKFTDTIRLMEYGFNNYEKISIIQEMQSISHIPVVRGDEKLVGIAYGKSLTLPLKQDEKNKITISIHAPDEIKAPISQYECIGNATVYIDGNIVCTLPIITTNNVEKRTVIKSLRKTINQWILLLCNE